MSNWFRKDLKIKIISVLLAIFFWVYVSNLNNPFVSQTFYNIPITIENPNYPEQNGFTIKNSLRTYVDITIRGRQDAVSKVRATDFQVTLDFSQIKSVSDKKLKLSEPICTQKDVVIESYNPQYIDIQLDRNKSSVFPVDLKPNITMKEGYVLVGTTVTPDPMPINGEESLIDTIGTVKASFDIKDLDRDATKQAQCIVYDKNGKEIKSLSNVFKVTVKLEVAKQIPVSLVTRGRLASDYVETLRVIDPVNVLVTGPVDTLANMKDIKTEQVDIDKLSSNLTTKASLVLPEGVKLVSPTKDITVNISVEKLITKDITLTNSEISILNANNDGTLVYKISPESVLLQFKGRQSDLQAIGTDMLRPAVDVSSLMEGTHRLPLNISLPSQAKLVKPVEIEVRIEKVSQTNPAENPPIP
ncbi:MAG TPA: CdaR family protein [Clostridia bacterium]|nr:CdaR family protein [Clostridia bacterium]